MTTRGYDVFLSHSSRNADLASAMKQYLGERGIRCWKAPDDIEPSEPWPAAIMRGLRECPIVVLIWTKESMASDQVLKEITFADQKTKVIIPFRAEEIEPDGAMEYFLVAKQWLIAHPDYQKALASLADTALRFLGRGSSGTSLPAVIARTDQSITTTTEQPATSLPSTVDPIILATPEASTIQIETSAELRPDLRKFLGKLAECEAFASDGDLRDRLKWNDKKLDKVKAELVEQSLIIAGTGRGGTSALSTPKLRQLSEELADESLPGCIFVNVGEAKEDGDTTRDWSLCASHGFISAGHGSRYAQDMKRIKPGATIYAYTSGAGYVGVGTATEPAVPLREFRIDGVLLQDKVPSNPLLFHHLDDLEMCEWVVRVQWDKTLTREEAIYKTGLFVYVATSCRIKDAITVQYLRTRFNQMLPDVVLTAEDVTR